MKTRISLAFHVVGITAALMSSSAALAANTWYTFTSATTTNVGGVNISAYSAANTSGALTTSSTWLGGAQGYSSPNGLTMSSDGSGDPNHAIDNNGRTEAIVLNFTGGAVALSAIGIGWLGCADGTTTSGCATDADITIYRYTGSATSPMPTAAGKANQAGMVNAGWALVGSYADLKLDKDNVNSPFNAVNGASTANNTLGDGATYSSWWMISAFNSGLDSSKTLSSGTTGFNNSNDYFKLYSVAAATCAGTVNSSGACEPSRPPGKLPEPTSLALVGLALAGVAGSRRRSKKAD